MNINRTLLNEISSQYHNNVYGCEESKIEEFLKTQNFGLRQNKATELVKKILTTHGKQRLSNQVLKLADVEKGIKHLQPELRDHVVHALLSFFLGIYINEKFIPTFNCSQVNPFQWKLACLLHDVAYPVQIAKDVIKFYSDEINDLKKSLRIPAPDIFFQVVPINIDKLRNRKNGLDLIQDQLNKWELQINAKEEYNKMIKSGEVCHGMIGALGILYVIDMLYQKKNPQRKNEPTFRDDPRIDWNQKYFDEDIVPACSAIFVHNLDGNCFKKSKVDLFKAPLAFLLKLSDVLQEWERPSLKNLNGYDAESFDIGIVDGKLILSADISEKRKKEMRSEIVACLNARNIQIE